MFRIIISDMKARQTPGARIQLSSREAGDLQPNLEDIILGKKRLSPSYTSRRRPYLHRSIASEYLEPDQKIEIGTNHSGASANTTCVEKQKL
jgi:hypothetical protein